MTIFIQAAVNIPQVSGVFDYHLPVELEGQVQVGHLVLLPFGKQTVQGVVLQFISQPAVPQTRAVLGLVDASAVITLHQIALAQHLAESTIASLAACIALMLPPGLSQQADTLYSLSEAYARVGLGEGQPVPAGLANEEAPLNRTQLRLVALLSERGPLRGGQIDRALPHTDWRSAARGLQRRGALLTQPVLPAPSVQPKLVKTVQLAVPPVTVEAALPDLGRGGTQALLRRQAILRFLLREPGPVDVPWVYAESGGKLEDLRFLAERGLVLLGESETWRDPLAQVQFQPALPPQLTSDQAEVWAQVHQGLQDAVPGKAPVFLLHGVTGAGKTEIYLRAVEETLRLGKQAIILVPEISLTPQTVRRFAARFPGRVGLVHSGLSPGERYDTWRRARAGLLSVVVGPRSALFTPFANLGLIVADECHDDSYYQEEPPHYDARQAAGAYAALVGAVYLMGSATPDVVDVYRVQKKERQLLKLPARILAHKEAIEIQQKLLGQPLHYHLLEGEAETIDLPPVDVIDMREELKAGNRSIFSRSLQAALGQVLEHRQQAILFLNRRGAATYVFCRECGHTLRCPRCDLPLTMHFTTENIQSGAAQSTGVSSNLQCHYCGYQRKMPPICPQCGSRQIRQYGAGTEKVEAEVQALFPQARTLRWDATTTRQKGAHEVILSHFAAQHADILVGTQMLAKGLDLPLVTLVGVVLADVGLNLPDYRSGERTFQLLTQVAGRAGRSPLGGRVVMQTFQPDHFAIQAAAQHDYGSFYKQELAQRRRLGYPPYAQLVRLEYRHIYPERAEQAARQLAQQIQYWITTEERHATRVVGPAPCFFMRMNRLYRWQLVLRGPDPASLLRGRNLGDWIIEVNPPSLL